MAALVHQTETQYPQATRKAGNSPKVTLVYAYGPPLTLGTRRLKLPKMMANKIAPKEATNQPTKLIPPKAASDAGNKNIPEPIMLPMTRAVVGQKVSFLLDIIWFMLCGYWFASVDLYKKINWFDRGIFFTFRSLCSFF